MAEFGLELSCTSDIDPNGSMVTGTRAVAEALFRRLITPRGRVIDDPNYGTDLRQFINDDTTKSSTMALQSTVVQECLKDERVLQCTCTATLARSILTVKINFTTADGPFVFVVSVDTAADGGTSFLSVE